VYNDSFCYKIQFPDIMKALISYVIQDAGAHVHQSEILEIPGYPWHCTPEVPNDEIMNWIKKRESELSEGKKVVLISTYKL